MSIHAAIAKLLLDPRNTRGRWNTFDVIQSLSCTTMLSIVAYSHDDMATFMKLKYTSTISWGIITPSKGGKTCIQLAIKAIAKK